MTASNSTPHFIPLGAPMKRFEVVGTPTWTPVWNEDEDRYDIQLLSNIRFNLLERGYSVLIKSGFVCDGASVPKRFWDSIGSPYASRYLLAAILHDGIYVAEIFIRIVCDAIFAEFMEDLGVAWIRREVMHTAVRWGGWVPWNAHTQESIAAASKFVRLVKLGEMLTFPAFGWDNKEEEKFLVAEGMFDIGI